MIVWGALSVGTGASLIILTNTFLLNLRFTLQDLQPSKRPCLR